MKREDAISLLKKEFGDVQERTLSDDYILVTLGPLSIPGGEKQTKVALKLSPQIDSVPKVFVETQTNLNSGGQPAGATNVDLEGEAWKEWSFKTKWNPQKYSIAQLVHAVLYVFNR